MWNSILAGVVFEHISTDSLRRELSRNAQLRFMCGFYGDGDNAVPPSYAYSRFYEKLFKNRKEIDKIFEKLVEELYTLFLGFGRDIQLQVASIVQESSKLFTLSSHHMGKNMK